MANFDPSVPQTGDPFYASYHYTQGTDRAQMQPLAEVPSLNTHTITPDYKANTSVGQGLKDVAGLTDAAVKLTDGVIQQKVSDTLEKGLGDIRNSFITAQATALGQNPATGLSLSPDDQGEKNLPGPVQKVEDRLRTMQEAYKQGVFDDTAYYGKANKYVTQVKTMFPGYSDVIDQKVRSILGVTPANALRSAQREQLDEINKKIAAGTDKQTTWENQNMKYVETVDPGYFAKKAIGQPTMGYGELQSRVAQLKARDYDWESKEHALTLDDKKNSAIGTQAAVLATQKLTDMAGRISLAATNSMGLKTLDDFQKLFDSVASGKRGPLSPEEKDVVAKGISALNQQYLVQSNRIMTTPLADGQPDTYESYINDNAKRSAIVEQGRIPIKNMEDALGNEQWGLFHSDARWNKATQETAVNTFLRSNKAASTIYAARNIIGDQGFQQLIADNPQFGSKMLGALKLTAEEDGYNQYGLAAAVTPGEDHDITSTFNLFRSQDQMNPALWKAHMDQAVGVIQHQDKLADPNGAKSAVQYLYGPRSTMLIDSFKASPGSQIVAFQSMVNPKTTESIQKMDATSQKTYYNFAEHSFAAVYATQAMAANKNAETWSQSQGMKLAWNPQSENFEYTKRAPTSNILRGQAPAASLQAANAGLLPLNAAINTMKSVWKAQGKNASEQVFTLLPTIGIYPHSPLYEAVHSQVAQQEADRVSEANK